MKKQLASFTASAVATLFSLCASAALTINSPADYSTVYTLSEQITNDLNNTSTLLKYSTYSAEGTTYRSTAANAYWNNSLPVTLSWTGDAANYTVKLWRSRDLAVNLNADPVFVTNTTAKSVAYYDPEVGRNYTWSVSDGTDTVTSHFFAANTGPRIIYTDDETEGWNEYSSNGIRLWIGRDLGGWKTSSGKVVRQGAIYRSAYLDYCAGRVTVSDTNKYRLPLYYLRDVLGIKFEIDLREKYGDDGTTEKYVSKYDAPTWIRSTYLAASNACVTAGGTAAQAHTAGVDAAALLSSIGEGIPRFNSENACGVNFWDYAEAVNGSSNDGITANQARSAMWHTFTNFFNEANYPVIFHCQYGKDRTGTLAAVILGLLGVDKEDINVDYALSWYAWNSDHYTMTSWRLDNFFTAINTAFPTSTYTTLSAQMEAYLKSCATAAGVTDLSSVDSSIAAFKTRMLEEPETAAVPPVADPDALAITAPADYSTVSTMNDSFRSFIMSDAMLLTSTFSTGSTTERQSYANWYNTSSIPVTLAWNGPEGAEFKVNVYRTREYAAGAAKPVFSVVTTARSAVFYDPETGRNYTWTVDDGTSLVAGRFYTQGNTPRIIYSDQNGPDVTGIDCLNGRDIGGWTTTDGKVVRQGMIYRSAELEPCQPTNSIGMKVEMPHLKNNLGIKLEVDLRKVDEINNAYMNVPQYSCPWKAIDVSCISPDIPRFNAQAVADESFPSYEDAIPDAATTDEGEKDERMAMWCAFTNFCDEAKLPAIFHCAHGKDRAGTVGYLLLGVLGVPADDAKRDFGLSWCYYVDESMDDNYGYTPIDAAVANLPTYGGDTLAEQCYNYFVACAGDAGVDEATAKAKIDTFRTLMLEEPETAAQAPADTGAVAALEASASYSTYPAKFVIEGTVGVGAGATTVTLYYALNDGSYESVDVALEADGTFAYDIPYTSAADTLKWYVRADSVYNGATSSLQTDTVTTARAADATAVVYTWTGAGVDGKWANIANWSADSATAFGYPDSANATASFTAAAAGAKIDLEGANREAVPVFAENAGEITMTNGALTVPATTAVIGAAGTTLTLDTDASLDVSGAVKVLGTCRIIIPEGGREVPLTAGSISYETSCTFNLDLTDYSSAGSITLARFDTALTALPSVTPVYTVAGETVADRGTLAPSDDYKSLVYTQTAKSGTIDVPAASENLVYTGRELIGVPAGEGYTLGGVAAASDVGSYKATVTLKSGYTWADGTADSKTFEWSIAKADNAWVLEPAISLATWKAGEEGGVLTPGVAKFGAVTATIAKDGGAAQPFDGTLPTEMGSYTITYTASAESTANYNAITETVKTVEFSITADPDDLIVVVNYETHPEPYFVISGIVTPGSGTTTVKINYALNSATAGNTVEVPLNDDGTFVYQIPYTEASDYLTWNVEVSSSDGGSVASEVVKTERVIDYASTVYLWTGSAGDNRWKNVRNWYADVELCYGYPGEPSTYWGHSSYMKFTASTDAAGIDLEDDSFTFIDNGAIILAEGIYVKFRNGAMTFMGGKMMNDLTAGLVGKANSTLVFEDVTLAHATAGSTLNITPYYESTLVFEGNTTATWIYKPLKTYTGTKFIVRNGTLSGNTISSSSTFASDYVVEISNGVWSVSGNVSTGIAPKVIFRDGEDREAQFITSGSLKLYGTYDIVIPAEGRTLPAVQAKTLSSTSSSVIKLDVTDYKAATKVPLVKFTSTTAQSTPASTLVVYDDGEDVTSTRSGAQLVFEDNVLYYVQDDQNPAESVPVDKPTAVTSYTYDGTAKTIATATDAYTVSGVASASEPGVYSATLTLNPGYTWADGSTDPLVIVWSISNFDADHTIICYGDSVTTGTGSTTTNMDSRANYFDGRLSGVDLKPGYPYWLSELLPSNYNVIHQARGSAQACNIMSWSGEEEVVVAKAFTLPSMGGSVVVSTNFVFKNCAWGPYGGWASIGSVEIGNDYESYYGFATPIYPLYENYDASTTADSITGTLAGRRVRLQGDLPHAITVTALDGGAAVEIAAGTDFIPDSASDARFTDAIRIYCIGGNDSNCSDDDGSTTYDTYIKGLAEKIKSRGGRYLIVSPSVDCNLPLNETNFKSSEATDFEAKMAAEFGDKFLNLRLKMIESAKETATELGVSYNDAWYDGWDGNGDGLMAVYVHYNTKGYKVMAEFIRQKLVALGYIEDNPAEEDPDEPGEGGGEGETPTVAVDPSWGYVVESPGGAANEYAVVFTNHTATAMQWTAPAALQNVQFLVVGGGGGGGADTSHASAESGTGGGGGGGGGVVTGLVNFAKGSVINVTVGNGGSGGKKDVATRNITFVGNDGETYKAYGDSGKAGDSYFSVGGNVYVKAYAGGGDLGAKLETDSVSNVAEDGGSGSGARWKYRWGDADVQSSATKGFALDDTSLIPYYQTFGNRGGKNLVNYSAAGGGGATTAGGNTTSEFDATRASGIGGEGLTSSITGTAVVYGSGGGGGNGVSSSRTDLGKGVGAKGGTGAGDGNQTVDGAGTSAKANQGGGGGGGGYHNNGGSGGSGIVVFRFSLSDSTDEPDSEPVSLEKPVAVADLVYNGNVLTGVVESNGYTLEDNTATDAGEYIATATLAEGYIWADGSTDPVEIAWSIAKAENTWTTAPSISKTTWEEGSAGEIPYSLGTAASGGAVVPAVTKDGASFTTDFTDFDSWEAGEYVITLTVAESDNYNELTARVIVTVTEPVIVLPDPVLGTVTTPIASADGKTPWGYVISGLGEFRNETAVVFTNENATGISWTVPADYDNVRFLVVGGGGGGGGDTASSDAANAGAGGGGGGVVTGLVNVASGDTIAVTVGAGGQGGVAGSKVVSYTFKYNGSSYTAYGNVESDATDSIFTVNGVEYVRAYAGGGDMGGKENSDYIAAVGGNGGSGAGTRPWADGTSSATKGAIGADASGIVSYQTFGNAGGPGIQQYSSGGGGGASPNGDGAGLGGIDQFSGGKGGEGLACDITGELLVYGSGGGGGNARSNGYGGLAGTGAGNGNYLSKADGDDALANQGGGGGGGGGQADGGNGGSGIVVFRYADTATGTIFADEVAAKLVAQPYTGEDQTCALAETMAYTVASEAGNEPGTYTVTVTPKTGYVWETGTNKAIDFNWAIIQSANAWVVEPAITKETWVAGEAAGELATGVSAKFGDVVATIYDVAANDETVFDGTLPSAVGDYIITYSVAGTDAYTALSKEIAFEITGTALTPVEKPVVSHPSLTEFEAGVTMKPAVMPAVSEAYTVTYETDFTAVGEHALVIELNEGYKWSDETIAPLEYTYLFVEREFDTYYWGTTDRWWNDYRSVNSAAWFVDAARTVKASTTTFEVDSYDAYVIADIPSGTHGQMNKYGLHPRLGRLVMSGELTLEGGSMWFKNETVTPVPYIVIGANSTLTAYPANFYSAEGCGYIDIGAGSLFFSKRAVADENVFIRFNTENAEGATLEVSRCDIVSEYGWFDGGTVDTTPVIKLDAAEYGALKFTNPDAVSGVAGPLALDLGFKSGGNSGMTLVEVAGTLNIQPGSTLAVNAGSLGAGTYSVLKAGVLNDNGDLVKNGTITGLKSGTYGTLVRSGNQIDLVITTTGPTVAGTPVAPGVVFNTACSSKPITYPCAPSIAGEEGAQTITWGGVTVDVPAYYKLTLDGNVVSMAIRDEAKPVIATVKDDEGNVTAEAIKIVDGKVKIHLENTHSALYYAILSATSLGDDATWAPYDPSVAEPAYERGKSEFEFDATDTVRFFKADVKDEE